MNASKQLGRRAILGLAMMLALSACGDQTSSFNESVGSDGGPDGGVEIGAGGGNRGGVSISGVKSQPSELGVGDLLLLDLNKSSQLSFKEVDAGAEFMVVLANTGYDKGNLSVGFTADLSLSENGVLDEFHEKLHLPEAGLEDLPMASSSVSAGKSVSANVSESITVGYQKSFKVLSSLSSLSQYVNVSTTAECVGNNVIFFVDTQVSSDVLSDADIAKLCDDFDAQIDAEIAIFGDFSDVDGNGKLNVVMTPQVNRLGGLGGGIVTGFFNARDLHAANNSNAAGNEMEVIFTLVPDPSGQYGSAISRSFAMENLLPAVLPHELQHAINYNQHVFVNKGRAEEAWLNEGLSHLAEDILGVGMENPSRTEIFLKSPQAYPLVTSMNPSLGNRGASYLFLRYLYEQSDNPSAFLKAMLNTSLYGVANIEKAFDGREADFDQFEEFFLRWGVALAMTDRGISQDPRFVYEPRVKDSLTGNWKGVLISGAAEDGRGTKLSGVATSYLGGAKTITTSSSAFRFYTLRNFSEAMSITSQLGEGYGALIRIK